MIQPVIRNKITETTKKRIYILRISETKIDESFPITEPAKNGFFKTIRPDGSSAGEGISIYICGTT